MKSQHLILVVDDSEVSRLQLRSILEPDYAVVEAVDGRQALARLADLGKGVSAVLLDLIMPELDGFGVLEAMAQSGNTCEIPVLVLTSSDRPDDELRALELGAAEFITKPYRAEIVRRRLMNMIRMRENKVIINTAESDTLTGLFNRDAFYRRLRRQLDEAPSDRYMLAAVNIDRFKLINDLFGVMEGDKLLRHVAQLLRCFLSENGGICGHLSGGHFAFLCSDEVQMQATIEKMLLSLRDYPLGVQVQLRFGIFQVENPDLEISTMCDRAILAAETVKGRYDCYFAHYDRSIRDRLLQEQQTENDMRPALEQGQYEVYYQPKLDLRTERIVGAEALVRWNHPLRGLLKPESFIPQFECNGFITELDLYVWSRVCRDMAQLLQENIPVVPVSINLSRVDVNDPQLVEKLLQVIRANNLKPHMLNLEITETAYTHNPRQLVEVVEQLKQAGFRIEMDDFGSGYSSLNMLSELPIDTLKLDMRFMRNDIAGKRNEILNFVVSLARWLGVMVIAEGVENEEQAQFLRSLNCNFAQGNFFSRPVTMEQYRQLLRHNKGINKPHEQCYSGVVELSELWSPTSAFNNIFNSFIGTLTIYEYNGEALRFIRANEKYSDFSGGSRYVSQGRDVLPNIAESDRQMLRKKLDAAWKDGREFAMDLKWHLSHSANHPHWLHMRFKLINRSEHRAIFLASQEDVTKSKNLEHRLLEASQRDSMTGLLNRTAFENAVGRELELQCEAGGNGAFVILDLDNFKQINDSGGHLLGDRVLMKMSGVLKEAIRGKDYMARLGGDEFAIYMRNIPSAAIAMDRIERICAKVHQFGGEHIISCSAGIALSPQHGTDFDKLYQRADEALYQAKRSGKSQYVMASVPNWE